MSTGTESPRAINLVVGILLANAITFAALAFESPRIQQSPVDAQLGLLVAAPPVYWIALGLALVAVAIALKRDRLVFTAASFILFLVWISLPTLLVETPYHLDSNALAALVDDVLRAGTIDLSQTTQAYLQFPGFVALSVPTAELSGWSALALARWSTFLWAGLFLVALLSLVHRLTGDTFYGRIAVLVSSFGNVWLQFHFAPQALAISMVILVLWVLLIPGFGSVVSAITMGMWLAVSHPPSMLFLVALAVAVWFTRHLVRGSAKPDRPGAVGSVSSRTSRRLSATLSGVIVMWITWVAYVSQSTLTNAVRLVSSYLTAESVLGTVGSTPGQYQITTALRFSAVLMIGAIGTGAVILLGLKRHWTAAYLVIVAWLLATIPFGFVVYQLHLLDRLYIVFLPAATIAFALLGATLGRSRATMVLVVAVVLSGAMCGITNYRDSGQYVVPFRWQGSSALSFRSLDAYAGLNCSKPYTVYIDSFTLQWTAVRTGSSAVANDLKNLFEGGSRTYDDGTTVGYFETC